MHRAENVSWFLSWARLGLILLIIFASTSVSSCSPVLHFGACIMQPWPLTLVFDDLDNKQTQGGKRGQQGGSNISIPVLFWDQLMSVYICGSVNRSWHAASWLSAGANLGLHTLYNTKSQGEIVKTRCCLQYNYINVYEKYLINLSNQVIELSKLTDIS